MEIPNYKIKQPVDGNKFNQLLMAESTVDKASVWLKAMMANGHYSYEVDKLRNDYIISTGLSQYSKYILQPLAFKQLTKLSYITYESFDGLSLRNLLNQKLLPIKSSITIALNLLAALNDIHRQNVVHGSLNSLNILISPDDLSVKLSDFRFSSQSTQANNQALEFEKNNLQLAYISPEQSGRINLLMDYRSDFYSLGILLYEMSIGRVPFLAQDPMELIHCHIALQPKAPFELAPLHCAQALSDIILKLLAKMPVNRYQSIDGIKHDLERCLNGLQKRGAITPFKLAEKDFSTLLTLPAHLYGRENELKKLQHCIEKVQRAEGSFVALCGHAGTGKTALVQASMQNGYKDILFARGKYEQYENVRPYSGCIQIIENLVDYVLGESEVVFKQFQSEFQNELGENAGVISERVPRFAMITGKQSAPLVLDAEKSKNRFHLVMSSFFSVFVQRDKALVIFIDDLQWADPASLDLLASLLKSEWIKKVLIIASYRDNQINENEQLKNILLHQSKKPNFSRLKLHNLSKESVQQLLTETFLMKTEEILPLIETVFNKTQGNAFYSRQLISNMYQEGIIWADIAEHKWKWDLNSPFIKGSDQEEEAGICELVESILHKLSEQQLSILYHGLYLGSYFTLVDLSLVLEINEDDVIRQLSQLLNVKMLKYDGQLYRFQHDRLQQSVAMLMPEHHDQQVHLNIARQFIKYLNKDEKNNRLLDIANHLNKASALLHDEQEKTQLFYLNYQASEKSLANCAYALSLNYAQLAQTIFTQLNLQTSEDDFKLALLLGRCYYLNNQYEQANKTLQRAADKAYKFKQKVTCYSLQKDILLSEGKDFKAVVDLGLNVLGRDEFAGADGIRKLQQQIATLKQDINALLQHKKIADLMNAQESKKNAFTLSLLADLWEAAYYDANETLMLYCVLSSVHISIEQGNCSESVLGYVLYGMLLTLEENYSQAYEFGRLALKLNKKFDDKLILPKVINLFCNYTSFHVKPFEYSVALYEESSRVGQNNGDYLFGLWASVFVVWSRFLAGQSLSKVDDRATELNQFIRQTHDNKMIYAYDVLKNIIESLRGKNNLQEPVTIGQHAAYLDYWKQNNFVPGISWYYILQGQYCCLMGNYKKAHQLLNRDDLVLTPDIVMFPHTQHSFYKTLSLLRLINGGQAEVTDEYKQQIDESIHRLHRWAELCPENFLYQQQLLEAERYCLNKQLWEATKTYNKAIESAERYQLLPAMALTYEITAIFWQQQNNLRQAVFYLRTAISHYNSWGALHKVDMLRALLNEIISQQDDILTKASIIDDKPMIDLDFYATGLDFNSILKFTRAISKEINSDRLIEKTLKIIIENAGADRAALLTYKNNKLCVNTVAEFQETLAIKKINITLDEFDKLPKWVVHYVERTEKQLLIENALNNDINQDEEYINQWGVQSMLCMPVKYKRKLNAILYIENHSSANVFNEQRANILHILLTQLEVSLHNAQLYQSLQKELKKNQQTSEALSLSEKRMRLSHQYANIGVWEWNIEKDEIYWGETIAPMFGLAKNKFDFSKKTFMNMVHPEDRQKVEAALDVCFDGGGYLIDHRIIWPDGSIHWILEAGDITWSDDGKPLSLLGIVKNITDRKAQEEEQAELQLQLQQAQKMEAIGQLTGGIAHDFNNMLASILGYSDLLKLNFSSSTDADPKVTHYIEQIISSGKRATNLISQMLEYSRGGNTELQMQDIVPLAEDVIQLLSSTIPSSISIQLHHGDNLPMAEINTTQLNQLLMNLCINARDAYDGKQGEIKIHIQHEKHEAALCSSCHKRFEGDFIEVCIEDNAGGIAVDIQNSIFNPFFTTKEVGKGTGMGLAMVHGIMHGHHGHVLLEVDESRGSRFRLLFPVGIQLMQTEAVNVNVSSVSLARSIRVLIIDDEPALTELLSEQLSLEGCQVTTCNETLEAAELIDNRLDQFDLMITDQTMPGMNGLELATRALAINSQFPVIICSGYTDQLNQQSAADAGIKRLLNKPVSKDELTSVINELMRYKSFNLPPSSN